MVKKILKWCIVTFRSQYIIITYIPDMCINGYQKLPATNSWLDDVPNRSRQNDNKLLILWQVYSKLDSKLTPVFRFTS